MRLFREICWQNKHFSFFSFFFLIHCPGFYHLWSRLINQLYLRRTRLRIWRKCIAIRSLHMLARASLFQEFLKLSQILLFLFWLCMSLILKLLNLSEQLLNSFISLFLIYYWLFSLKFCLVYQKLKCFSSGPSCLCRRVGHVWLCII